MFWALCTGRPQHLWQTDQINCIFSKWLFNSSRHLSSCILIHLWLSFSFCEIESSFSIGRVSSFIKMESAFSNAVDDRVSSFIETMGKPRKHDKWVWLLNIITYPYERILWLQKSIWDSRISVVFASTFGMCFMASKFCAQDRMGLKMDRRFLWKLNTVFV